MSLNQPAGGASLEPAEITDRPAATLLGERRAEPQPATAAAPLRAPVAIFLFNRPQTTAQVFAAVRRARPKRLLLIADGPRPDAPGDTEQCAAAREAVARVDWDCDVAARYAPANLGPKRSVESGLDWVFEQVESAILLEDDCLPGPEFFAFCDGLLDRYLDEERVMSISGNNFQFGRRRGEGSYYFSRYPLIWGWATWRRAWRQHDASMKVWPAARDSGWLAELLGDETAASYWSYLFQKTYEVQHAWDYPWTLSCWARGGLSIIPGANLVSNIGYGPGATHTRQPDAFANLPVGSLDFPLRHPARVERDAEADAFTEDTQFSGNLRRLLARARALAQADKAR